MLKIHYANLDLMRLDVMKSLHYLTHLNISQSLSSNKPTWTYIKELLLSNCKKLKTHKPKDILK